MAVRGNREKVIVKSIMTYLKTLPGCWAFKVHGGVYQNPGIPDIVGCRNGVFFGLEVKTAIGKPTELQTYTLQQIGYAGGINAIVRSVEDVKICLGVE